MENIVYERGVLGMSWKRGDCIAKGTEIQIQQRLANTMVVQRLFHIVAHSVSSMSRTLVRRSHAQPNPFATMKVVTIKL
jgi:hypothetical protein